MSKLITSAKDKEEVINLLKQALATLVLEGTSHENRIKVLQHVAWLETNLTEFNVDAMLQSNQMQTKFTFTIYHGAGKFTNG